MAKKRISKAIWNVDEPDEETSYHGFGWSFFPKQQYIMRERDYAGYSLKPLITAILWIIALAVVAFIFFSYLSMI